MGQTLFVFPPISTAERYRAEGAEGTERGDAGHWWQRNRRMELRASSATVPGAEGPTLRGGGLGPTLSRGDEKEATRGCRRKEAKPVGGVPRVCWFLDAGGGGDSRGGGLGGAGMAPRLAEEMGPSAACSGEAAQIGMLQGTVS
ncbi:hypothetical protein E2562_028615 [Oryza meyeriana var. granulata]|uniref:Uncharacterized protein n=1 Tax=Oryza meyeriana var. granulata TaxID=110450 RepID=A0A6G1DAP0_9ORYZ|nr:hypothetical protein E2562_028615 [Oryza meyeriana var. granulata]